MNAPLKVKIPNITKELAMNGRCSYFLEGDTIHMEIDAIANNRIASSLSGGLSLELWALPAPYQGGYFSGQPVAGCRLGVLRGQHELRNWQHQQLAQPVSEGLWYLTLMLRERDNGGYVTRDYMNFPDAVKVEYKMVMNFA